jgi:ribosome biogenesis GTPase
MREFGILGGESGIEGGFADLLGFAEACRFRNCSHTSEAGCAVLEAVNSGAISRAHYDNFLKLRAESAFHDLSYAEKRKKDRDFGRFLKSVKKDL